MTKRSKNVIGIDVGGSTTKIVGFKMNENGENQLISPFLVRATDPITSIYGAFGKFTAENNLSLEDIDRIMVTGVGATHMQKPIYSLDCHTVPEFSAAALGGLYLSGLEPKRRQHFLLKSLSPTDVQGWLYTILRDAICQGLWLTPSDIPSLFWQPPHTMRRYFLS